MTPRRRLAAEHGFTLLELVLVSVMLAILITIAAVSYLGYRQHANDATARSNVRAILPAIESYHSENSTYLGMTLLGLKLAYDQSIDPSMYKLTSLSDTGYCVSSAIGGQTWKRTGPGTDIVSGDCP